MKVAGFLLCALFAAPGFAQTLRDAVPSMEAVRSRLHLTPEQEAKLTPIFRERELQLMQTRSKLELAATKTEKREILRTAKSDAQAFDTQVSSVLDSSQKSEWHDLRDETREKVKENYQRKRESQQ